MLVVLILAIAFGLLQLYFMIGALVLLSNGVRSVTVGILPGIVSAILFALYFLL